MFSDFFRTIFGGMGGVSSANTSRSRSASGYQQPVTISLNEAFNGTSRQLQTVDVSHGSENPSRVKPVPRYAWGQTQVHRVPIYTHDRGAADDPRFERDGNDLKDPPPLLTCLLPCSGGEADVETMTGKVKLSIPAGNNLSRSFAWANVGCRI